MCNKHFGQSGAGPVMRLLAKVVGRFGTRPEEGAQTSLHLAASPAVEGVTGQYWVKSRPRRSAAISYDEVLQRQLWAKSVTLVKL
jgi:retinol dehydrogenase 14